MLTWQELGRVIEQGQMSLKTDAHDFLPAEENFSGENQFLQNDNVDSACRFFAQFKHWPDTMTPAEKHAVAQRVLLALIIVRTMHASFECGAVCKSLSPPTVESRLVIEWLLIWAWKAGGAKLMPNYRHLLFTALDYAGMTKQFRMV